MLTTTAIRDVSPGPVRSGQRKMGYQSYEATLLSRGRLDLSRHDAQDELQEIVEDQGLVLERFETMDDMFLMLDCGPVQVLIALCNEPMKVSHFVNANRPAERKWNDDQILGLLHGHEAISTVLVTDTPGTTHQDPRLDVQKRMLCADLTDWMFSRTLPDLVFWSDTDTLYAGPEFDLVSMRDALSKTPGHSLAPAHFQTDPPVWDKAETLIEAQPNAEEAQGQTPAEAMAGTMLGGALPPWAATRLAKLRANWESNSAVKQATRACTVCTLSILGAANYGGPLI